MRSWSCFSSLCTTIEGVFSREEAVGDAAGGAGGDSVDGGVHDRAATETTAINSANMKAADVFIGTRTRLKIRKKELRTRA